MNVLCTLLMCDVQNYVGLSVYEYIYTYRIFWVGAIELWRYYYLFHLYLDRGSRSVCVFLREKRGRARACGVFVNKL